MKKKILFTLLAMIFFILVSCSNQDDPSIYTVTFDTMGGSKVDSQLVEIDGYAVEPIEPHKDGYQFRYWYHEDRDVPFDFKITIASKLTLNAHWGAIDIDISFSQVYEFSNLTTEFELENGTLSLYFTEGGSIPYVKVTDFFDLLVGFIDPEIEFTITEDDTSLNIFYQYYAEDEDKTYDLVCNFDLETNLITTNDPGFYYAYIYSTKTNYARNIEYLYDYALNEEIEGHEIIYNLNMYQMDLDFYDGSVVAPYYLINQLFAGSSYYNVYFNGDKLYGIYGQVSPDDSATYYKIRYSSKNGQTVPDDLLQHSYNMLIFDLDYFYGLKDYKGIDSFHELLAPYKKNLLSSNYKKVSQTIADLLYLTIDEPHTSYGFSGYYGDYTYNPSADSLDDYGKRFNDWYMNGLYAVNDVIAKKWNVASTYTGWAANSPNRPQYWFIDDVSAVISFDNFTTADIEETQSWTDAPYQDVFDSQNILPIADGANRYLVYNQSSKAKNITETLIWGLKPDFLTTYANKLVNNGWTFVIEHTTKTDYHTQGYYTKTINDVIYMTTISYDEKFDTAYIGLTEGLPSRYNDNWSISKNIAKLIESDSAVYLEMMINKISQEKRGVKNIGLDLTFNTGGNLGALYRILGLMSDQPFGISSFNRDAYSYSTTYVTTSYNSYDKYDWFLLSSYVTFSAANELTTIFKQNDMGVIIGQTSGGGASSITPILLPDGTLFTMSSNNIHCYKDAAGNYIINETGIKPDFIIKQKDLYNNHILSEILKN